MRHVPRYDVLLGVTFVATNKWAFQATPFGLKGAHEYAQQLDSSEALSHGAL